MDIGTLTGVVAIEDQLSGHLNTMTTSVWNFVRTMDVAFKQTALAVSLVTAATVGAAISIVALGEKGSVILGVEDAFNKLAVAAGSTGEAMLGALNEGVKGTVDSMDLMKATTKLLSSDLKISADDMKLLAQTSREMGKASGEDAAQGLNVLSNAIVTGNARSLKRYGIQLDLVAAEKQFRAAMGDSHSTLTAAGKLEVNLIAVREAARIKLDKYGESQISFKERVQRSSVAIGNWFDELAKGVAASKSVNAAWDAMSAAFVRVFGGTTQTALQTIIGLVNKFADGVTSIGPRVIEMFGNIRDKVVFLWNELVEFNDRWQITNTIIATAKYAWGVLETAFGLVETAVRAVIRAWAEMPEWLQRLTKGALEASIAMAAYSIAIKGVAIPFQAMIGAFDLGINIVGNLTGAIFNLQHLLGGWAGLMKLLTPLTIGWAMALEFVKVVLIDISKFGLAKVLGWMVFDAAVVVAPWLALGLAIYGVIAYFDEIKTVAASVFGWLKDTGVVIWTALGDAITYVAESAIGGFITELGQVITKLAGWGFIAIGVTLWYQLEQAVKVATQAISLLWNLLAAQKFQDFISDMEKLSALIQIGLAYAVQELGKGITIAFAVWRVEFERLRSAVQWLNDHIPSLPKIMGGSGGETPGTPYQPWRPSADPEPDMGGAWVAASEAAAAANVKLAASGGPVKDMFQGIGSQVDSLLKSWTDATKAADIFRQAFEKLSPPQLANLEIQELLVPAIQKYADAGGVLSSKMVAVITAEREARLARLESHRAILEQMGVTAGQIEQLQQTGLTLADLARAWGVDTEAITAHTAAQARQQALDAGAVSVFAALIKQQEDAAKRRQDTELSANKAIADADRETNEMIRRQAMTTTEIQIEEIEKQAAAQIALFSPGKTEQQINDYTAVIKRGSRERINALTQDNEKLRANNKSTLDQIAYYELNTYDEMRAHPEQYSQAAIEAQKKVADAAVQNANITRTAWDTTWDTLKNIAASIPDVISQALISGGNLLSAMKAIGVQMADAITKPLIEKFKAVWGNFTTMQKAAGAAGVAAGAAIGGAFGGSTGAAVAGVAASIGTAVLSTTALGGASVAAAIGLGAATAGIGAAAVGVFLLAKHFLTVSKEIKQARENVKNFEEALAGTLTQEQLAEAAGRDWAKTVIATRDAYLLLGKSAADAERDVKQLWDTDHPARSAAAQNTIALNVALAGNIRAVRSLVQEYIGAGEVMPEALQKNIDQLVKMGKLTAANATEMLNLQKTAVPSYADLTSAAERYKFQVESLGTAVQAIRITELATQAVADWKMFEQAGADMVQVMIGMQEEVQALVTDALKMGVALPRSMEPMLLRMAEAGLITDLTGDKMMDLSKLTFAETLTEKIEKLVDAMLKFVDAVGQASGAMKDLGGQSVPSVPSGGGGGSGGGEYEPSYAATTGMGNNVLAFRSPTMRSEGVGARSGGGGTVIVELDRRMLARAVMPEIAEETKRLRLGR